jgi:hypothetical protein
MADETSTIDAPGSDDPRSVLASWANHGDEWVRYLVQEVLASGRPLTADHLEYAHALFRQEKGIDDRVLPTVGKLSVDETPEDIAEPLRLVRISEVTGVNAIEPGSVIEPHEGLTVLFGENGTGKTGYARVLKALAGSRTADTILGNVTTDQSTPQSAKINYTVGDSPDELLWKGEQGRAPFTRMSIFDSPAVNFHVDEDLEYVYVPASLALFNHVNAGLKGVQERIDGEVRQLNAPGQSLLSRFNREASVYASIETLGASTDLTALSLKADNGPNGGERIAAQQRAVAALEANTTASQITITQRSLAIVTKASEVASVLSTFDVAAYNSGLTRLTQLTADYETFRVQFFAAANLPSEPEDTWAAFVASGETYREHLRAEGAHDEGRCIYCRQSLGEAAVDLVNKYREYLDDKIAVDIREGDLTLQRLTTTVRALQLAELTAYVNEANGTDPVPIDLQVISESTSLATTLVDEVTGRRPASSDAVSAATALLTPLTRRRDELAASLVLLREQAANREDTLAAERRKLVELSAAVELKKSWPQIDIQVKNAKEADRLGLASRPIPSLGRQLTDLSKVSSDQMINQSFDTLFAEECAALRAPQLRVQFVGRQGKAQRRKTMPGNYKPSKVLSEGEQKVLAIADFLAEARLTGISATVVFDDPVSSLDHRRINEVADRIAKLAELTQVIVFTHDIFFATNLLSLFETSKRCTYYQVTDEDAKGTVTHASGPRWDTLKYLKSKINEAITDAKNSQGETRAAFIRTGYSWIRSWCEVLTETELLQGITQRYQPNVRMQSLANLKLDALGDAIKTVTTVFDDACRYIEGHSQPLATLGVSPTLAGLEADWQKLQDCKKTHDSA